MVTMYPKESIGGNSGKPLILHKFISKKGTVNANSAFFSCLTQGKVIPLHPVKRDIYVLNRFDSGGYNGSEIPCEWVHSR